MALVIGHQGAPTQAKENSVGSFAAAKAQGADGVELDVRRAHEGRLVVWHDPVLADGRVLLETPWPQLNSDLYDLEAVLDATAGFELVNVEIKNLPHDPDHDPTLGIADAVMAVVASRRVSERNRILVSCFHVPTLRRVRELAPEVDTGWLLWNVDDIDEVVTRAARTGYRALHPHHGAVTPELVERAHAAGLTVNCWTCNDLERMAWLASIGTDGIITDVPGAAKRVLRAG